jgi:hypothetical protein
VQYTDDIKSRRRREREIGMRRGGQEDLEGRRGSPQVLPDPDLPSFGGAEVRDRGAKVSGIAGATIGRPTYLAGMHGIHVPDLENISSKLSRYL